MSRHRLPYLHHERTRHGKLVWYVRINKGQRIRLYGEYGSIDFIKAYQAALTGEILDRDSGKSGTLSWLIARYRKSSAWEKYSPATKRQRDNIFRSINETAGLIPFRAITRRHIVEGRERRKATPAAANNFIKTMKGLFDWAVDEELIKINPTTSIKTLAVKGEGFHSWTDEEISAFEQRWLVGTRERLAFDILLYTGLRRGDAARLGHQHVREGVISIRTEKTGEIVTIPVLPPLQHSINATKTGDLTFIATERGTPMVKESFGNWFKDSCNAANVPGSAHGLRKAGASRAAANGATEYELNAIFGWRSGNMASLYTRKFNREKLAKTATDKLLKKQE